MNDLNYPKNGGAYLLQRIHEMHAQVADLIDELVRRDQEIALLKAQGAVTKPDAPDNNPPQ